MHVENIYPSTPMILTLLTRSMHWIYLKGTVGSSASKGLCGKVSEVTSLKKFLTIRRTLNTEFSSATGLLIYQGCKSQMHTVTIRS